MLCRKCLSRGQRFHRHHPVHLKYLFMFSSSFSHTIHLLVAISNDGQLLQFLLNRAQKGWMARWTGSDAIPFFWKGKVSLGEGKGWTSQKYCPVSVLCNEDGCKWRPRKKDGQFIETYLESFQEFTCKEKFFSSVRRKLLVQFIHVLDIFFYAPVVNDGWKNISYVIIIDLCVSTLHLDPLLLSIVLDIFRTIMVMIVSQESPSTNIGITVYKEA